MSPSEELKEATLLASMEVGRLINQRDRTPKCGAPKQQRLLKARLKPLNTVNVTGPTMEQCRGVQAGENRNTVQVYPIVLFVRVLVRIETQYMCSR